MAQVDFTNATIAPYSSNPMGTYTSGLNSANAFYNSGSTAITSSLTTSTVKSESGEAIYQYTGTFSATGTEFYFGYNNSYLCWKVSNISFNSGDTFTFKIKANIV